VTFENIIYVRVTVTPYLLLTCPADQYHNGKGNKKDTHRSLRGLRRIGTCVCFCLVLPVYLNLTCIGRAVRGGADRLELCGNLGVGGRLGTLCFC